MFILQLVLLSYFSFVTIYSLIFSIASLFKSKIKYTFNGKRNKFAVLIPSYREDNVIVNVAREAVFNQSYPSEYYDVVVIADTLKDETILKLKELPIIVHEVVFEKSTKVRSLNSALSFIGDNYDYCLILDADNVMKSNFIELLNNAFNSGYKAIHGQRVAKNKNTDVAILDGLSEYMNNKFFRKGYCNIGWSSTIIGSGFAVDFKVMKEVLSQIDSIGGFDKELELKLIESNVKVKYIPEAIIYDEKVDSLNVFKNQRKRWVSSQFYYLKKYWLKGTKKFLKSGSLEYFNSAVLKPIQLPRLISMGLLLLMSIINLILSLYFHTNYDLWLYLFLIYIFSIILLLPKYIFSYKALISLLKLPVVFIIMLSLMFKMKGANKKFIHTPHKF